MFNGNRKFGHFSEIWKRKRPSNSVEFCNFCWKMAKNAPFHIKSPVKNFHGRAKGRGASHRAPLNTPLAPKFDMALTVRHSVPENTERRAWRRRLGHPRNRWIDQLRWDSMQHSSCLPLVETSLVTWTLAWNVTLQSSPATR